MASFGVVLPAAGSGTRFGSDKLMADLCGKPVLLHTVSAFQQAATVDCIVVVTRKEMISVFRELLAPYSKVVAVVEGGETRTSSVLRGVEALPSDVSHVSIHDAARPLLSSAEIDRIHGEALRYGSVCAALPVVDTIQQVDDRGYVVHTPPRSSLLAAVTPQVFPLALYKEACEKTAGDAFTDDTGMILAAGGSVKTLLCQEENFKITTLSDLHRAVALLNQRRDLK